MFVWWEDESLSRPSWPYDFSGCFSKLVDERDADSIFAMSPISLGPPCLARMYNKVSIWGCSQAARKRTTHQVFDVAFAPLFPVRGLQRSVWFQRPVDDLDVHCRSEINLTELHYVLVLPVLVATFR